jgi:23S rRNA (adenine2503-C2)-methyltransferase
MHVGDLTLPELTDWLAERGEKPFRARQIFRWLNLKGAASYDEMTDLPARTRDALAATTTLRGLEPVGIEGDAEGTRKLLFRTQRGEPVEAVLIPMAGSFTLCVSCQAGCRLACAFCLTGALRLSGHNLTAGEIVDQFREAVRVAGDPRAIDNVVFMGMGEPLFNYRGVTRAIALLSDPHGRDLATRRITVSTAGVAPLIARLVAETGVQIAISLNAVDPALRERLMPITRRWSLPQLRQALADVRLGARRSLTIEYVLLGGVNDGDEHALALADWLAGLRVKVNVIPFNEHAAAPFVSPTEERLERFVGVLVRRELSVQVRRSRGRDLKAACGQLGAGLDYQQFLSERDDDE